MLFTPKTDIISFTKRGDYFHDSTKKILSVNVAGDTANTIHMNPISCRYNCPDLLVACEVEMEIRKWSETSTWT